MFIVNDFIHLPWSEFQFSFARSSGPGGQNVNKVNSKAILRWCPLDSRLRQDIKERFLSAYGNQLSSHGELIIASDRYRSQMQNQEDCLEKLSLLLKAVAFPPKKRKATRPTRASQARRRDNKRQHGEKKRSRSRSNYGD